MMMRSILPVLAAALLAGAAPAFAIDVETRDAVRITNLVATIAQDGRVMDGPTAAGLVRNLRRDGATDDVILDVLRGVLRGNGSGHPSSDRGLGGFVQDAKARGLRGRALAEAIHAEQARRGVPGQARRADDEVRIGPIVIGGGGDDHPGRGRGRGRRE